ncbi:pirin family protein [Streptomyces sp. YC504]|uniref:Pirin family protein n=1 Tax=Streptomyces mesophilus TaxID=1775132 RepID=A0A6G4XAA9_9ACTN|nr:pirin-like C-terminal cupin domain-containing protein [Streptomyces mesophilus]NGO74318.1 pirin family protein [Streptomyces mesophilus]
MSNLDREAALSVCGGRGFVVAEPVRELLTPRTVRLGESTEVRRLLPNLGRRMVGAWCFVDHYGPDDIADEPGMQVPPHPHMGLQTVSWLHDGEVLHRDSTGSLATIRPRELGLQTTGSAISHSEETPKSHSRFLHGAQLWTALPDGARHVDAHFEHHTELPQLTSAGLTATVILGTLDTATSPGATYSPIVGADLTLTRGTETSLPLEPDFEYAVLSMSGEVHVDAVPVVPGSMLYLGCGRTQLPLRAESDASIMLLGGEPFEEEIIMWWNFIGRTQEDIAQARSDWMNGDRFGEVKGYDGDPIPAPELPSVPLKPRGRVR